MYYKSDLLHLMKHFMREYTTNHQSHLNKKTVGTSYAKYNAQYAKTWRESTENVKLNKQESVYALDKVDKE